MLITTTFWSEEKHNFDKILYISGKSKKVLFQANLASAMSTYLFFKNISKFVKSTKVKKTLKQDGEKTDFYQFAVIKDNAITPIVWFEWMIDETCRISHDLAFGTTIIKKNKQTLPLAHFPMWYYSRNIVLPKYWEFNVKSKAYKYMANQVKKLYF